MSRTTVKGRCAAVRVRKADQIARAHQILDGVQYKGAIVGKRRTDLLAENVLNANPEAVIEDDGVCHHDDVDLAGLDLRSGGERGLCFARDARSDHEFLTRLGRIWVSRSCGR